jgi:uridylate kinase
MFFSGISFFSNRQIRVHSPGMNKKYNRILLKLSGEALLGDKPFGVDYDILNTISGEVAELHAMGVEIAIVIGGGNIWRGAQNLDSGIDRVASDSIGMLATVMNAVALQASLEKNFKLQSRVCSAIDIPAVAEPYIKRRAVRHLEKNRIVICAAGTGNPYFTTDSAATLRALELECEVLFKATNVDGVYDSDPRTNPDAKKYDEVTFDEVLEKNLKVMDSTAIAQCRDNNLPLIVFKLMEKDSLKKAVCGEKIGTKVVL